MEAALPREEIRTLTLLLLEAAVMEDLISRALRSRGARTNGTSEITGRLMGIHTLDGIKLISNKTRTIPAFRTN